MRSSRTTLIALTIVACAQPLLAQRGGARADTMSVRGTSDLIASLETRVFQLQYLRPDNAASLVSPFLPNIAHAGVFQAGGSIQAITVKAPRDVLARVDSVLRAQDKPPTVLRLRFQIIAALDSSVADPAVSGDVIGSLRELFKYRGYRLIGEGVTVVQAMNNFRVSISSSSRPESTEMFYVVGDVRSIAGTPTEPRSVQLSVALQQTGTPTAPRPGAELLSTGLTVPIGQTIVLGSGAGMSASGRAAIILVVTPEVQGAARPGRTP